MTVPTSISRVEYDGNGLATTFAYPFKIFGQDDLRVSLLEGETEDVLVAGTDYTVNGVGSESGGAIVFTVAPASGKIVLIIREIEITQETDLRNQGAYLPETVEDELDRSRMIDQQLADDIRRSIRVPPGDDAGFDAELPRGIVGQANRAVITNGSGTGFEAGPTANEIANAQQYALDAGASKNGAQQAASDSANSASLAQQQADRSSDEADRSSDEADRAELAADILTAPVGEVAFFQSRSAIPAGRIAYDGQLLSRATYPDHYQFFVDAGLIIPEATWQADPTKRGMASDGDGSTTYRVPDFNGKSAGSLGAVYLTGDGLKTAGTAGTIREDEMQQITGKAGMRRLTDNAIGNREFSGALRPAEDGEIANYEAAGGAGSSSAMQGFFFDSANSPGARTSTYTHGTDVSGVWCGRAFGAVVNVGSADAAQLASDYANLAGRVSALEAEAGLGWSQTWQDVSASRNVGLQYVNSTGRPVIVSVTIIPNAANTQYAELFVDSVSVAVAGNNISTQRNYTQLVAVVPDGSTYEVSQVGTVTISRWAELR